MADMQSPNAPARRAAFGRFIFFLKFLEIRLRFVAILVVTAVVVGYWDYVQNYYERWQRERAAKTAGAGGATSASQAAQSEFEYYCPMHTFVVRDHEGSCPICGHCCPKQVCNEAGVCPKVGSFCEFPVYNAVRTETQTSQAT
jgi:hypothetical protein